MTIQVSRIASQIQPSPTLAIDAKAKKMRAEGIDVVLFGTGEPDFDTPGFIKQAAIEAINKGFTKYTPAAGTEELRKAVAAYWQKWNGLDYDFKQVVVSCGAKHSITNVALAALNPGDEVLIPAPYWVSYPEIVKIAGAVPVILPTREEDGYLVDPAALEKAITPRTKLFILCSPSNPTGAVYPLERLKAVAAVLANHGILTLSDEIYDRLLYAGAKHTSLATLPGMKELVITVNGTSKTFAMTGWRIGYAAGPHHVGHRQHPVACHQQPHQHRAKGRLGRHHRAQRRGRGHARRVRQAAPGAGEGPQRHPRHPLPGAQGRLLCLPQHPGPAGPLPGGQEDSGLG
jgi:aspartate aminotransferase